MVVLGTSSSQLVASEVGGSLGLLPSPSDKGSIGGWGSRGLGTIGGIPASLRKRQIQNMHFPKHMKQFSAYLSHLPIPEGFVGTRRCANILLLDASWVKELRPMISLGLLSCHAPRPKAKTYSVNKRTGMVAKDRGKCSTY